MQPINWFPGHMKKTRDLIRENLKLVDTVIEVIDARIPISSRNPIIDELAGSRQRIIVLNKSDLADPVSNERWIAYFTALGWRAAAMDSTSGEGAAHLMRMLQGMLREKNEGRTLKKPLRMMIVGIPNVGKSSLINRLTGRKSARTGNKPGVTRGKQWLNLGPDMQLLDMPGILWPKFDDQKAGEKLAFTGSIRDEILDLAGLALALTAVLAERFPALLLERYKLDALGATPLETMERIAARRGFILSGERFDYERTARTILDEYRAGKIGRITLEWPEDLKQC